MICDLRSSISDWRRRRRKAFTLVELLVVIAIIVLLLAILIPAVNKGFSVAEMAKATQRLELIGTALKSYEMQHETYPISDYQRLSNANHIMYTDEWSGAELAAQALIGYLDEGTGPNYNDGDGVDGEGFRMSGNTGKVFDPYYSGKSETLMALPGVTKSKAKVLVDPWEQPILYFKRNAKAEVTAWQTTPAIVKPNFRYKDNEDFVKDFDDTLTHNEFKRSIVEEAGEQALRSGKYLLISFGRETDAEEPLVNTGS